MEYLLTGILYIIVVSCVLSFLIAIFMFLSMSGMLGKKIRFCFGHNYKFSQQCDDAVNYALNNCRIAKVSKYEIMFENGLNVWIYNKWYGYGHIQGRAGRVSWNTAKKLIRIERSQNGK